MPGGKIDDEIIELSPHYLAQKLLDDRMQHGTAPNQRFVAGIQKSDRNHFKPMRSAVDAIVAENFWCEVPSISGTLGPYTSASSKPTL